MPGAGGERKGERSVRAQEVLVMRVGVLGIRLTHRVMTAVNNTALHNGNLLRAGLKCSHHTPKDSKYVRNELDCADQFAYTCVLNHAVHLENHIVQPKYI